MILAPRLLIFAAALACTVAGTSCTKAMFWPLDAGSPPSEDAAPSRDASSQEPIVCSPTPASACQSKLSPCDPVCQDGTCPDWCNQKCSYAYGPDNKPRIACVANQGGKHAAFERCTPEHLGTDQQTDDCEPGNICLPAFAGEDSLCFKLCHDSTECIAGQCAPRALSPVGGTVMVCDPPYTQCGEATRPCCDPFKNTGCDSNQYCFLTNPPLGSDHSFTLCDYSYGNGRDDAPCTSSRDCQRLYTCIERTCRPACTDSSSCPSGKCVPYRSEYGYCQ